MTLPDFVQDVLPSGNGADGFRRLSTAVFRTLQVLQSGCSAELPAATLNEDFYADGFNSIWNDTCDSLWVYLDDGNVYAAFNKSEKDDVMFAPAWVNIFSISGIPGIGSFLTGDVIVAQGDDDLVTLNIPDHHILLRDAGEVKGFKTIDPRIIEVYGTIYTASTGYVWTKNSFTTLNDPTGYASLSGGSLLLEAGTYLFIGAYQIGAKYAGGNTGHGMRLYNSTAASTIAGQRVTGTEAPVVDGVLTVKIGGQEFDSNGSDAYDSEYATNGTWIYNVQMTDPQHFYFRRIG